MGYNPSYKWINPTYPIYNWGYNPLTKWDEPPSSESTWQMHPLCLSQHAEPAVSQVNEDPEKARGAEGEVAQSD